MTICPQCHLVLGPVEHQGLSVLACRGCGGCWFPPDGLEAALAAHRTAVGELDQLLPQGSGTEAYAGLSMPCPACRVVLMELDRTRGEDNGGVWSCPRCGGNWLMAGSRSRVAGTTEAGGRTAPGVNDLLEANAQFAQSFPYTGVPRSPARKLVIVTCMDGRIPVFEMFGLALGDAQVLRNAGGIVTEDVLRSLVISHHVIGTEECVIVNHTHCGMLEVEDSALQHRLAEETGMEPITPASFYGFKDLEANVRRQIRRVRSHPWIPRFVDVRGFVYDVETGRLTEVV